MPILTFGEYTRLNGTKRTRTIKIETEQPIRDVTTGDIIFEGASVFGKSSWEIDLPGTDAKNVSPRGFTYQITLDGEETKSVGLPSHLPIVDFDQLAPVETIAGGAWFPPLYPGLKGDKGDKSTVPGPPGASTVAARNAATVAGAHAENSRLSKVASELARDEAVAATGVFVAPTKERLDFIMGGDIAGLAPKVAAKVDKSRLALNVSDFGAAGDGVTDDTAALQSAITAAAGSRIMLGSGKRYKLTKTLIVMGEIDGQGSTLEIGGDFDGLLVSAGSFVHELTVKVVNPTYTKTAVRFDTIGGFNVLTTAAIDNVVVIGVSMNGGIAIGANDNGVKGVVAFVTATRLHISNFAKGIELTTTFATSWMNGNRFQADMYRVKRFIEINGIAHYNIFEGQCQSHPDNEYGIKCHSDGNDFVDLRIWDSYLYTSMIVYDLTGAYYCRFGTQLGVGKRVGFNPTNSVPVVEGYGVPIFPKVKDRATIKAKNGGNAYVYESYLGEQDNVLKNAHLFHTVTTSWNAPADASFSFGGTSTIVAATPGTEYVITITSATPFSGMQLIGVLFTYGITPDYLRISTASGAVETVRYETTDFADVNHTTREALAGTFTQIVITFSCLTAKSVRVGSIYASSGTVAQRSFLQTDGGKVYGPIEVSGATGKFRLKSPNGTRYALAVSDVGALTAMLD